MTQQGKVGVMGWDVGGAHLKCALIAPGGELLGVQSLPCPLWQGLGQLAEGVDRIARQSPLDACHHAITMTGELCDLFPDRDAGVHGILDWFRARLPAQSLRVYGRSSGLQPLAGVVPADVASMNWHATASAVARVLPEAVLVDVGSTTTDIIPLSGGEPAMQGVDDRERLASGELLYQGVVRTPVMALATRVPYRGREQGLAAEYFATTADVFRLTGSLPAGVDVQPTADGRGKSLPESAARLARMVGDDYSPATAAPVTALASHLASLLYQRLDEAVRRLAPTPATPLVGAGIGRFMVRQIAAGSGRPYLDFAAALGIPGELAEPASEHAAAVAVARLGLEVAWP